MKTLHVEIGEIAGISSDNWQGAGFGGPLVMTLQTNPILLSLLFSFIYPTVSSGTQSIHSHAAKIEIITQKILEMNNRGGDSRINEGKEEAEENKSWM